MGAEDFTTRLMAGERVVWSGQPGQGLMFTARDGFLIPFSLLWGGFAIFWEYSVLNAPARAPGFFPLFGSVFVAVGLYFIFGRFLVDAWIRRRMVYAITNRRILIARASPFAKFTALNLDKLPVCDLTERQDGSGTIKFGESAALGRSFGAWTPALDPTPQFLRIKDARTVFNQIQRIVSADAFTR